VGYAFGSLGAVRSRNTLVPSFLPSLRRSSW
jgi:hypothetical protein